MATRKIFHALFFLFLGFMPLYANADLQIISREQWGADENMRYIDSHFWQEVLAERKKKWEKELSFQEKQKVLKQQEKHKKIWQILTHGYLNDIQVVERETHHKGNLLAWPVEKTQNVRSIVIHHTLGEYNDMYDAVRKIYKLHTLDREWGDIGYNYLIGDNGEIFEGRAGGDRVIAAHDKWNNRSTVGIALIGDYSKKSINDKQQKSLQNLIVELAKKHQMDLSQKQVFHKECFLEGCDVPLESYMLDSIIGHRDAGHTSCPGEELYKDLGKIKLRAQIALGQNTISKKRLYTRLEKINKSQLHRLVYKLEILKQKKLNPLYEELQILLIDYLREF